MKKLNKKGFTLAELLIVIAIIAVLIAIAIPTFSGALDNARLQTDHANIRSAYAMVMTANMMGGLDADGNGTFETVDNTTNVYVFQQDGSLKLKNATDSSPYKLQTTRAAGHNDCKASVGCKVGNYVATGSAHTKTYVITIQYTEDDGYQLMITTP